jgi:hypothetical protein
MIITGKSRNNAAQAADYLSKQGQNERTELIGTRGTLSEDIAGACAEMEAIAAGSKCKNFLYHLTINPPEGKTFTPEQWEMATALAEKKLGLENAQRVIVEHEKKGRVHRHFLYNRVDQESIKAVRMGWNYAKHEETGAEIEKLFDLEKTPRAFIKDDGSPRANIAPTEKEIEEGKRKGVSVPKWRKECRAIVAGTNGTGAEIIEALESHGHMVARGDKVSFLLLDPSGTPHRMGGSLGIRKKEFDEIFKDIDPANLPSVEESQKRQQERQEKERAAQADIKAAEMYDSGGMASQQKDALQHVKDRAEAREQGGGAIGKEEVPPSLTEEQQKKVFTSAKERAEWGGNAAPLQYTELKKEEEPKRERYGQRESLARDKAPQMHKRATTEQTDSKQRRSARDALKEASETDFSKYLKNTGGDREQDGGRERERER